MLDFLFGEKRLKITTTYEVIKTEKYIYYKWVNETGETLYNITLKEQPKPNGGYLNPQTICKLKNLPNLWV